jgi:hypothetical protein
MSILETYTEMKLSAGADADKHEVVITAVWSSEKRIYQNRMSDVTAGDDHFHITTPGVAVLVPLERVALVVISDLTRKDNTNG